MRIVNHSGFAAICTDTADKQARKHLLVVVKASYHLPAGGAAPQLCEIQQAPVDADSFTGAPGLSAPEYECDFVLAKPRCEVLLLGSAYAPHGAPAQRVPVSLQVGALVKGFDVLGPRRWRALRRSVQAGPAAPFTRQPISYDIAFGGAEHNPRKRDKRAVYLDNPSGTGYQKRLRPAWLDGAPMAQTEAAHAPILRPDLPYRPMGFGPLGRNWRARLQYAGTYDAAWRKTVFPFLPHDFDERYFQSAPPDQQLDALHGGERVTLVNLTDPAITPSGRLDFTLPPLALALAIHPRQGGVHHMAARADTLLLEPDLWRFCIVWRASWPLRRELSEIAMVEIGTPGQAAVGSGA